MRKPARHASPEAGDDAGMRRDCRADGVVEGEAGGADSGYHRPVMVAEVLQYLNLSPGRTAVDTTLGGGGHAEAILEAISPGGELIGIDRDPDAIGAAMARLDRPGFRVRLIRGRMGEIAELLRESGVDGVDAILADLGVSSFQLDAGWRGFSFREDAPLDMRMDPTDGESAAELIARLSEEELANVIWEFGEERNSRRIARRIKSQPGIATTAALAAAVAGAFPPKMRYGRIHPATRTFQALRIAVNDEMGELDRFLADAPSLLSAGGRIAVISYHSLEDRRVKRAFRGLAEGDAFSQPVRKAIAPTDAEIEENPRARSAKLRVIERTP